MFFEINMQPEEILVYLRKSRADDALLTVEEVLQKHETILDDWSIANLGNTVPEENKYREVVSGETIDDRPEIKTVLQRIENPRIKGILVVEVQRLSRGDLEDAGRLIKLLRYTNTLVITPQKTYNLHDEYDRDIFERELKRGNEFLEYQKRIMNRGRLLSVQQGNYIASVAPYGYRKTTIQEGKKKCPTLEIVEDEAEIVRKIYDLYINHNYGGNRIAQYLDNLKIKPPKGQQWSPAGIKEILGNIHYTGRVKWNWRKTVTIVESGEILKTRPKSTDYLVFDGKHPAVISDEIFKSAQEKQGRNHRAKPTTKVRNPLAGLLYCKCGRVMSLRTYKRNGKDRSAPRLLCDNQANCHTASCLYSDMIDLIKDALNGYIADFEILVKGGNSSSVKLHAILIKKLEKKLEELEKKEVSLWDKYSEEGMPKHIFEKLKENVLTEKKETAAALHKAKETMPTPAEYKEKMFRFRNALEALRDDSIPAEITNNLLKACIDRIEYSREKPERLKRKPNEKKGASLPIGGGWTNPPINIDVKLKA